MTDLILKAARFAAQAHAGQTRKDGVTPYIVHPGRVAMAATLHHLGTAELVAAAWLHDTIEDTEATYPELLEIFGSRVADVVQELTNQFERAQHPDKNRKERKRLEFERLAGTGPEAKLLKLLDRRDNLGDMVGAYDDDFMRLYAGESRALLAAVGDVDHELRDEILAALEKIEAPVETP